MKKTLRLFFVAALAMVCGNAFAQSDVKFDFTDAAAMATYGITAPTENGKSTDFESCTFSGITISATNGTTSSRIFKSTPSAGGEGALTLRLYKNATLTISAESNFKSITFETNANNNISTTEGTYNAGVWSGDAKSVTFNFSGTVQVKTITISTAATEVPEPAKIEEINVAKAIELCEKLDAGKTSDAEYRVKGFVVGTPAIEKDKNGAFYGNANFYMADTKGGTTTIYAFRINGLEKGKIDSEDYLKDGDEVVVQAKLQKYVKGETTTLELVQGYIYTLNGSQTRVATLTAEVANGRSFNIAGQQVKEGYRGLIIKNGKKYVK